MSEFAKAAPFVSAIGDFITGGDQSRAMRENAAIYHAEARTALAQGYEAEAQQRRTGAAAIGREVAAAGQAGAGYGGSVGRVIRQSAISTELDALNIRYKAALQGWGYNRQADIMQREAGGLERGGILRAGAALLQGYGNYAKGTGLGQPSGGT